MWYLNLWHPRLTQSTFQNEKNPTLISATALQYMCAPIDTREIVCHVRRSALCLCMWIRLALRLARNIAARTPLRDQRIFEWHQKSGARDDEAKIALKRPKTPTPPCARICVQCFGEARRERFNLAWKVRRSRAPKVLFQAAALTLCVSVRCKFQIRTVSVWCKLGGLDWECNNGDTLLAYRRLDLLISISPCERILWWQNPQAAARPWTCAYSFTIKRTGWQK